MSAPRAPWARPPQTWMSRLGLIAASIIAGTPAAWAAPVPVQPPPKVTRPAPRARPWEKGVSEKRQLAAEGLLKKGKSLFYSCRITKSRGVFERALRQWDHPIIEHALALALVAMGRPTEAYGHLKRALRYGAAPFEAKIFADARRQLRRLERSIARLRIQCAQPRVKVFLDGKPIHHCPGIATRVVPPGRHQLVAQKPGHIPLTRTVGAFAGQLTRVRVRLEPLPKPIVYRRRWPAWMPWTVLGVGVALAVAGAPLVSESIRRADRYDRWILANCLPTPCTSLPAEVRRHKTVSRASLGSAIGLFTLGAAAMVTGVVLVIKNAPTPQPSETATQPRLQVVPQLGPRGAGLGLTLRY